MKKSILSVLAVLTFGTLVAQNNPPATNPTPSDRRSSTNTNTQQGNQPGTNTQSQSGTGNMHQVPGTVNSRFSKDYPNMTSTWSQSDNNFRAEYMDKDSRTGRAIIYDQSGNPIGTEREIGSADYPKTITEYNSTTYPNETYKVWSREDSNGNRTYYTTRKNDIIWYDDKGNYKSKSLRGTDIK